MERLTYYDALNKCYKIKGGIVGRSIVQELGVYEDIHAQDVKKAEDITALAGMYIEKGVELNPYWQTRRKEAGS